MGLMDSGIRVSEGQKKKKKEKNGETPQDTFLMLLKIVSMGHTHLSGSGEGTAEGNCAWERAKPSEYLPVITLLLPRCLGPCVVLDHLL